MRNRRDRRENNRAVIHYTVRTLDGLPFIARNYLKDVIAGIMARGQSHYKVNIVAFLWMGNHYHAVVSGRVNLLSGFTNFVHGETSKAIKRLFPGLYAKSVWGDRPHEQRLITSDSVIEKIAYLYANPARSHLVDSIDEYPGYSSWQMFKTGSHVTEVPWIPLKLLSAVPRDLSAQKENELRRIWKSKSPSTETLTICPYLWKKCFPETACLDNESIYKKVVSRVRECELETRENRAQQVLGVDKLITRSPYQVYTPSKEFSLTPFVQSSDKNLRDIYVQGFKRFTFKLRAAARLLMTGELKLPLNFELASDLIPVGGYFPGKIISALIMLGSGFT